MGGASLRPAPSLTGEVVPRESPTDYPEAAGPDIDPQPAAPEDLDGQALRAFISRNWLAWGDQGEAGRICVAIVQAYEELKELTSPVERLNNAAEFCQLLAEVLKMVAEGSNARGD